jgi:hypothetical protein
MIRMRPFIEDVNVLHLPRRSSSGCPAFFGEVAISQGDYLHERERFADCGHQMKNTWKIDTTL